MTAVDAPVATTRSVVTRGATRAGCMRGCVTRTPCIAARMGLGAVAVRRRYDAARDTSLFSSAHGLTFSDETAHLSLLPTIVMMDPPTPTDYRRLVSGDFTARRVRDFEDDVRAFARERIAALVAAGEGEFVSESRGACRTSSLRITSADRSMTRQRFDAWTTEIVQASPPRTSAVMPRRRSAICTPTSTDLVESRRADPGPDMLSAAIAARPDIDTAHLVGYAFVMVTGGTRHRHRLLAGVAELLTSASRSAGDV